MTDRHLLCLYPWLALGGADKFNLDMIACLTDYGWRVTIVTTQPGLHHWRDDFARLTDDIIDLTMYRPEEYPAQLTEIIRSHSIDCVLVSHSSVGYELLPYLRAHLPHITYVAYCHFVEPIWGDGGYPRMGLTFAPVLDLQIVSSHTLKQWMCERGADNDRIAVVRPTLTRRSGTLPATTGRSCDHSWGSHNRRRLCYSWRALSVRSSRCWP